VGTPTGEILGGVVADIDVVIEVRPIGVDTVRYELASE